MPVMARNCKRRWGPPRAREEAGYTLLELLVVLAILVFLTAIAVPQVIKYLDRAKTDTARIEIENISATLDLYRLDVGRYPSEQEGLIALVERPASGEKWNGPYLKKRNMILDPWENPYNYRLPGEHGEYDLFSFGADGSDGGEGPDEDLVNW